MDIQVENWGTIAVENGATPKEVALLLKQVAPEQAVAVAVNGEMKDFSCPLNEGDHVRFYEFAEPEGKEVFWHTSAHVLAQAVLRLYPDAKPSIGPPIEGGFYYDFGQLHVTEEDLSAIEKEMQVIVAENFTSERVEFTSKQEALEAFGSNPYKKVLIDEMEEGVLLTGYRQGEFFDLCRGPHLAKLGKIKALKLLKTSGAYFKGDSQNEMLTRIYGVTFPDKKQLKSYLEQLAEAKKRDHKVLGPKLGLFSLKEEAPGMPFIHPKGLYIWHQLTDTIRHFLAEAGYQEIKTPSVMTRHLWEQSGHWQNYRENMFAFAIEERDFAIKPMNCPGCILYYKSDVVSYRSFPLRIGEIGNVHRFEPSGALSGLFRVRSFHQDDAHIFLEPHQIKEEILTILELADRLYSLFGLEYHLELSTRPEEGTIGTDAEWEQTTKALREALEESGHSFVVNEGDGAFYGPKIDVHIRDAIGRTWQCGTIQLDMSLPEKFSLEYTASDGTKKRPVMIHRALFGSVERFFGILIEHFAGRFPLWLSPSQIYVIPVADRHHDFAFTVAERLKKQGLTVHVDSSSESVSKKVRQGQIQQYNYLLTIGDQEVEHQTVNIRTREGIRAGESDVGGFLEKVLQEKESKSLQSAWS